MGFRGNINLSFCNYHVEWVKKYYQLPAVNHIIIEVCFDVEEFIGSYKQEASEIPARSFFLHTKVPILYLKGIFLISWSQFNFKKDEFKCKTV